MNIDTLVGRSKAKRPRIIDLGKRGKTSATYDKKAIRRGKKTNADQAAHKHWAFNKEQHPHENHKDLQMNKKPKAMV